MDPDKKRWSVRREELELYDVTVRAESGPWSPLIRLEWEEIREEHGGPVVEMHTSSPCYFILTPKKVVVDTIHESAQS